MRGGARGESTSISRDRAPVANVSRDAQASGLKRRIHCNVCHSSTRELALFGYCCGPTRGEGISIGGAPRWPRATGGKTSFANYGIARFPR